MLEIVENPNTGLLSGNYIEYHNNGNPRLIGNYKIVEILKPFQIVNIENYIIEDKCCGWMVESVKYGNWREYDFQGEEINIEIYDVNSYKSDSIRELTDKYSKMNINKLEK